MVVVLHLLNTNPNVYHIFTSTIIGDILPFNSMYIVDDYFFLFSFFVVPDSLPSRYLCCEMSIYVEKNKKQQLSLRDFGGGTGSLDVVLPKVWLRAWF